MKITRRHATTSTRPTTTTTRRGGGLFSRRRPAVRQKRRATFGDKVSGALTKLKGTIMGRPGEKAAGTRRMHGTDGRGSHRSGRRRFF